MTDTRRVVETYKRQEGESVMEKAKSYNCEFQLQACRLVVEQGYSLAIHELNQVHKKKKRPRIAHFGVHATFGEWQTMYHALFNLVYDHQGGPRGGDKTFVNGMLMGMAQRPLGDGTFGLRAMLAPDPFMGKNGYPLLLATGETADGQTHLIDRQHPHDLFMELATTYSYAFNKNSSVYVYAGLPGEPALGPSTFMHRTSGMDIPEAPITHHWLDSTHITFGVLTAGVVLRYVENRSIRFQRPRARSASLRH